MTITGLDHVQLAMPPGEEPAARQFYEGLLGLRWVEKPPNLAARGGCWFEGEGVKLHLGVEEDFRPARKAHPGLLVSDLAQLAGSLNDAGYPTKEDEPLEGYERAYVADPFGNRLELLQTRPQR